MIFHSSRTCLRASQLYADSANTSDCRIAACWLAGGNTKRDGLLEPSTGRREGASSHAPVATRVVGYCQASLMTSPCREMTTSFTGRATFDRATAAFTIWDIPRQQGTSIMATVMLFRLFRWIICASFST